MRYDIKNSTPLVSVIVNCYNGEKFLSEALRTIKNQTYKRFEVVFIDNNSSDKSAEIYRKFSMDDIRFMYYRLLKNVSLGEARKFAVTKCKGDYIAFLDVDDLWDEKKLQKQIQAIVHSQSVICYSNFYLIDEFGLNIGKSRERKVGNNFKENLIRYRINLPTLMVSKAFLETHNLSFDENIEASEEYCLVMQMLARNAKVYFISERLASYRHLKDSLTVRKISSWFKDRRYTLDKIENDLPNVSMKYGKYFDYARSISNYYEALYYLSVDEDELARRSMANVKSKKILFFVIRFALKPSFIKIFRSILEWKYGRGLFTNKSVNAA